MLSLEEQEKNFINANPTYYDETKFPKKAREYNEYLREQGKSSHL